LGEAFLGREDKVILGVIMGLLGLSPVPAQFYNCRGIYLAETLGKIMYGQSANAESKCKEIA
jgi:hypothetical protein